MKKFKALLKIVVTYLNNCNSGDPDMFDEGFLEEVKDCKDFDSLKSLFWDNDLEEDFNECLVTYFQ